MKNEEKWRRRGRRGGCRADDLYRIRTRMLRPRARIAANPVIYRTVHRHIRTQNGERKETNRKMSTRSVRREICRHINTNLTLSGLLVLSTHFDRLNRGKMVEHEEAIKRTLRRECDFDLFASLGGEESEPKR